MKVKEHSDNIQSAQSCGGIIVVPYWVALYRAPFCKAVVEPYH